MTHNLEAFIEAALIMFIAVCWGALVLIFTKIFQGRLGFRSQDRFYSLLDDVNERLAIVEMTLEQLRPKTQTGDLGRNEMATCYNDGARSQLKRDIEILIGFEAEIGNSRLLERVINALKT